MRSTFWLRAPLGVAFTCAVLAGCSDDQATPVDDDGGVEPIITHYTASEAFDAAVSAVASYAYENTTAYAYVDGDTVAPSTDYLSLVAMRADRIVATEGDPDFGRNVEFPWSISFVDTTLQRVNLAGNRVIPRYDVTLYTDGRVEVGETNLLLKDVRAEVADSARGYLMDEWSLDTGALVGEVLADSTEAGMARARIDSLLSEDFYIIPPTTYYAVLDTFWIPPDDSASTGDFIEFSRYTRRGGGAKVRFTAKNVVLNTTYLKPVTPVVLDADTTTSDMTAVIRPGWTIQGYAGDEVRTGPALDDPAALALYRAASPGTNGPGTYWAKVDGDRIEGEIWPTTTEIDSDTVRCECVHADTTYVWEQSINEPCTCAPEDIANGEDYLAIAKRGGNAQFYDPATHYDLTRTDRTGKEIGRILLSDALMDGSGGVTMVEVDSFYVTAEAETVWVDPNDTGVSPARVSTYMDVYLEYPSEFSGYDPRQLYWTVTTHFEDEYGNDLLFGDPVVDRIPAAPAD